VRDQLARQPGLSDPGRALDDGDDRLPLFGAGPGPDQAGHLGRPSDEQFSERRRGVGPARRVSTVDLGGDQSLELLQIGRILAQGPPGLGDLVGRLIEIALLDQQIGEELSKWPEY